MNYPVIHQSERLNSQEILLNAVNTQLGFGGGSRFLEFRAPQPLYTRTAYASETGSATPYNKQGQFVLEGFSPVKEIFSPDYSVKQNAHAVDNRSTLYWDPYINTTKEDNNVPILFYNSDNSKKFRVTVTGMLADGKMLYIEKIIE